MMKMWALVLLALFQFLVVSPVSADGGRDDKVVFGGNVIVEKEDVVDDLVVFGGNATVLGTVGGDLVVFGGNTTVSGQVQGSIIAFGGIIELKSASVVGKDVAILGGSLKRESGAVIGGSTVRSVNGIRLGRLDIPSLNMIFDTSPLWEFVYGLVRGILATLALLALGVLAVAFFPRQLEVTEDVLENSFWQSAGMGVLTFLAAVFLTPVLVISIIGIPVALLLWFALFFVYLYSLVASANMIGERVMRATLSRSTRPMENTLLGILLIMVVAVPFNAISGGCLGTILLFVVLTPGVGATALSRFGTVRWRPGISGGPPPARMFPPPPPPASPPPAEEPPTEEQGRTESEP